MQKTTKETISRVAGSGILSALLLLFVKFGQSDFFLFSMDTGITKNGVLDLFSDITKTKLLLIWIIGAVLWYIAIVLIKKVPYSCWQMIYKYRYLIGIIIIVICVMFELSGTSISWYSRYFSSMQGKTDTLFRSCNPYRSDEFVVNTILAVSQGENPYQSYPYLSEIVRGTTTDMFIVYGQPVWHYGIIFRPFHIGYLLLGSSRGLSFFWCARLVFLFLVTFDFGVLLTNGKKKISVCLAIMITLAPVIQWWFAINGLVEQLIFGQLCVLALNRYMREDSGWKRVLLTIVFFWSGGCYILVFYPAWQISFGYVFLFLFVAVILKNRKRFIWSWKKDLPVLIIIGVIWLILLGSLFLKSWDTISTVLNTVYPGRRICTDKFTLRELFAYAYNIFLPIMDTKFNVAWVFIDFFPLGIILGFWLIIKEKQRDILLICMNLCEVFFLLIYLLPVPEIILKITLLSMVPATRALIPMGFLNILILIRVFSLKKGEWNTIERIVMTICYPVVVILIAIHCYGEISTTKLMVAMMGIIFAGMILLLSYNKKEKIINIAIVYLLIVFLFCGGLVNPIQKGIKFILDCPVVEDIAAIAKADKGKWIVEGSDLGGSNIPLLGGAATINSTNVYPDIERWKKLDSNGENEEIYNRYAHILIELVDSETTSFELLTPDMFRVKLNFNDLEKLDVSYILSQNELEGYSNDNVTLQKIKYDDGWFIYQVSY